MATFLRRALLLVLPSLAVAEEDFSYDTFDGVDRYIRFERHPNPLDKEKAILGGGDVKCTVCEVILVDIMQSVRVMSDRDALLEAMEADSVEKEDVEKAATDMLKHVAKHKKGCNKLFKDNFFLKGWDIVWDVKLLDGQTEESEHWKKAVWAYARHTGNIPNETEVNTYTVSREVAHYACEHTVAKHRDELAAYLAKQAKALEGQKLADLVAEACKKKAKCQKRANPSEAIEARSRLAEREFQGRQAKTMELFLADQKEKKQAEKEKKKAEKKAKKMAKKKAGAQKKHEDTVEL